MKLRGRSGYTLVEVIVVLVLLTIAAAVVSPSLFSSRPDDSASLRMVINRVREAAVRRGEVISLHIGPSGVWQAKATDDEEALLEGRVPGVTERSIDLVFSPLGTCGPAAERISQVAADIDPLTCETRSR